MPVSDRHFYVTCQLCEKSVLEAQIARQWKIRFTGTLYWQKPSCNFFIKST